MTTPAAAPEIGLPAAWTLALNTAAPSDVTEEQLNELSLVLKTKK